VRAELVETRETGWLLQFAELGESGGHGERIAGKCARLIDGADGCEHVHHVGAAAEGTDGQAAADDLAEAAEVGC